LPFLKGGFQKNFEKISGKKFLKKFPEIFFEIFLEPPLQKGQNFVTDESSKSLLMGKILSAPNHNFSLIKYENQQFVTEFCQC